jgi:predicted aspartyl protease
MPQPCCPQALTAVLLLASTLSIHAATSADTPVRVDFTVANGFMVVVPVHINGTGPYDFLLDTGASRSMVVARVADRLALPATGRSTIVGIHGTAAISLVQTGSLSLAGATVPNLQLSVIPKNSGFPSNVAGVLGEDFLEKFDVLLDNRHHTLELQPGSGSLSQMLSGERLPLQPTGVLNGEPTAGRIIVQGHARELGDKEITLLLDSGANSLMWFHGAASLGPANAQESSFAAPNGVVSSTVYTRSIGLLQLGQKRVPGLTAWSQSQPIFADTDAALPTSVFHSIFISHSQRYVIFDPSRKK